MPASREIILLASRGSSQSAAHRPKANAVLEAKVVLAAADDFRSSHHRHAIHLDIERAGPRGHSHEDARRVVGGEMAIIDCVERPDVQRLSRATDALVARMRAE
jgi:hypothetical protein